MQKSILTFLALILCSQCFQAQSQKEIKEALSTIAQSYIAWQQSSCFYMAPGEYLNAENSEEIIGQKFYLPTNTEFFKIELAKENGKYTTARMGGSSNMTLTWDKNKLTQLKAKHLYNFDYQVIYAASGRSKQLNGTNGSKLSFVYDGDQLKEITAVNVNKDKTSTSSVRTIVEENGPNFKMTSRMYTRGKPMKDKNIRQNLSCSCEKLGEKKYKSTHGWGDSVVYTFDEAERLTEKIIHRKNGNEDTENYYFGAAEKLVRKDVSKKEGGNYKGKQIVIYEIPENIEGLLEWEKRKGVFNAK